MGVKTNGSQKYLRWEDSNLQRAMKLFEKQIARKERNVKNLGVYQGTIVIPLRRIEPSSM